MKIWRLGYDSDNYDLFMPMESDDWDLLKFDGTSVRDQWTPLPVKAHGKGHVSDIPSLSSTALVFSERAVEVLREFLEGRAEILPLSTQKGTFFAINVVDVADCIDYEKSEFWRFQSTGRIADFYKYEFHKELVMDRHLFKIVDERFKASFVSDAFRERVLTSGLEGFVFKLVWDSEA